MCPFARSAANTPIDFAGLKGSAGTTFSRLSFAAAGLLADSPALLRDIQALNPHTPAVHRRVRDVLDEWRRAAEARDAAEFVGLIEETRKYFEGGTPP